MPRCVLCDLYIGPSSIPSLYHSSLVENVFSKQIDKDERTGDEMCYGCLKEVYGNLRELEERSEISLAEERSIYNSLKIDESK